MKKVKLYGIIAMSMVIVLLWGVVCNKMVSNASEAVETNYEEDNYEQRPEDNVEPEEIEKIAPTKEEKEALYELYKNIPVEQLEEFRTMTNEEVNVREMDIFSSYAVGQAFSEEDTNFMMYARYENNITNFVTRVWKTRQHKIKNSKNECGVNAGYDGYLETWSGTKNSQYGANVKCTLSKKVKSAKFKVHHAAYGVLGWNGKIPTIGIIYDDAMSSSDYKQSFTFKRFQKYTSILPVYVTTWGELVVVTDKGEFNVKSKLYKTYE